jgi:hypothetical protein
MEEERTHPTSHIEKLTETNYRAWCMQIRAVLREQRLFAIVEGSEGPPIDDAEVPPQAQSSGASPAYVTKLEAFELRQMKAVRIILHSISSRLLTYVENVDDPAKAWRILKDKYAPSTNVTKIQSLREYQRIKMAEGEDMEVHIRNYILAKRKIEEHGFNWDDLVHKAILTGSVPDSYRLTATFIETNDEIDSDTAINRLMEEARRRKVDGDEAVMAALYSKGSPNPGKAGKRGKKTGNSGKILRCAHCPEKGNHVESDCWKLHPEKRPKKKGKKANSTPGESAKIAFSATTANPANTAPGTRSDPSHWVLDSGASEHFTPFYDLFDTYEALDERCAINTAEGVIYGKGNGSISVQIIDSNDEVHEVTFHDVIYAPAMKANLLSIPTIVKKGLEVRMHPHDGTNIFLNGRIIATTVQEGGVWRLRTVDDEVPELVALTAKATAVKAPKAIEYDVWHRRLAHLNKNDVIRLEDLATGVKILRDSLPPKDEICPPCVQGKQARTFSTEPAKRASRPGDLVHSDTCGPIEKSKGGAIYFGTFTDDATRVTFAYLLHSKSSHEWVKIFRDFKKEFEKSGRVIRTLRTDGGTEYLGEMAKELALHHIKHETTPTYTPTQNGVAERVNRTIIERVRAILAESRLPSSLWAELVRTVVYLKNRCPTSSLPDRMTPYEALFGEKPDLRHLRVIGTQAFPHVPKEKRTKLELKSPRTGMLVGYEGRNQYRIWIPSKNHVEIATHVVFASEGSAKRDSNEKKVELLDTIEVLPLPKSPPKNAEPEPTSDEESEVEEDDPENDPEDEDPKPADGAAKPSTPQPTGRVSSRPNKGQYTSTKFADESYDKSRKGTAANYSATAFRASTAARPTEPTTYDEAINDPIYGKQWEAATKDEIRSLIENGTFAFVDLPKRRSAISCKWVFKLKLDENGDVVRFKARLVARGFSQVYGVDYLETYAPVAKMTTIRLIFAIAAMEGWHIHQMDVKTAFLLGLLDEEIYMEIPEGFELHNVRGKVCKLLKSLYGLKQASRVWNRKLHGKLESLGFVRSEADHCLYIHHEMGIYIAIWVDDILIVGKELGNVARVKEWLAAEFEMTDMGELKYFLGIHVKWDWEQGTLTL